MCAPYERWSGLGPVWCAAVLACGFTGASAQPAAASLPAPVGKAVRQYLAEQARARGLDAVEFEIAPVGAVPEWPGCKGPLGVDGTDVRRLSRIRVSVSCTDPARPWREDWTLRVDARADVVIASAPVAAQRPITAQDVAMESRPLQTFEDGTSDIDAVVGQTSRRPLRPGQVVVPRYLDAPLLVRKSQPVTIAVRRAGVEVNGAGEALAPGALGETVRVRNIGSGKVIQARVVGEGLVEPVDIGAMAAPSPQSPVR
ncbi:flagellar basal body P-ring formation chaperone FlgA [Acidovorax sp. NCPPB 2350]|nr:flagellar basal body P-ring formation chaperone FlgA [Acidovorax sp. NCPPB 2350]